MYKINQVAVDSLRCQIEETIKLLKIKKKSSNEDVIGVYINLYENALDSINLRASKSDDDNLKKTLVKLLNCARGYMETSSDYTQIFLTEMSKTEKLIKSI